MAQYARADGQLKSEYIQASTRLWVRVGRTQKRAGKSNSELVRETEIAAMAAKIAAMEDKIAASKEAKKGKGGGENQTLLEGLAMAKAEMARKRKEQETDKEQSLARAAIDFMGLKDKDVEKLRKAFAAMDTNDSGSLDLTEFFKYIGVERTPFTDSVFFFLDGNFTSSITFGTFLRTVCTFCMFGAKELVVWVFAVVSANIVQKAEQLHHPHLTVAGHAGAKGVDRRRNRSVYWEGAVSWSGLEASDTQGKMSVKAFETLLQTLHSPTSAMAQTVRRAVEKAKQVSVGDNLRLFQFRQLVADFPTLLSPVFLLQTAMRQKLMGEAWWGARRQLFADARNVVKEQYAIETRMKLLAREEERAKRAAEARAAQAKKSARGGRALEDAREPRDSEESAQAPGRVDGSTPAGTG